MISIKFVVNENGGCVSYKTTVYILCTTVSLDSGIEYIILFGGVECGSISRWRFIAGIIHEHVLIKKRVDVQLPRLIFTIASKNSASIVVYSRIVCRFVSYDSANYFLYDNVQ